MILWIGISQYLSTCHPHLFLFSLLKTVHDHHLRDHPGSASLPTSSRSRRSLHSLPSMVKAIYLLLLICGYLPNAFAIPAAYEPRDLSVPVSPPLRATPSSIESNPIQSFNPNSRRGLLGPIISAIRKFTPNKTPKNSELNTPQGVGRRKGARLTRKAVDQKLSGLHLTSKRLKPKNLDAEAERMARRMEQLAAARARFEGNKATTDAIIKKAKDLTEKSWCIGFLRGSGNSVAEMQLLGLLAHGNVHQSQIPELRRILDVKSPTPDADRIAYFKETCPPKRLRPL